MATASPVVVTSQFSSVRGPNRPTLNSRIFRIRGPSRKATGPFLFADGRWISSINSLARAKASFSPGSGFA